MGAAGAYLAAQGAEEGLNEWRRDAVMLWVVRRGLKCCSCPDRQAGTGGKREWLFVERKGMKLMSHVWKQAFRKLPLERGRQK